MRKCAGCGYLVPPAWDECKKCGAALGADPVAPAEVRAPAPATVAASPVSSPGLAAAPPPPASPFGGPAPTPPPSPFGAPASSAPAADWSAPARLTAPTPASSTPWGAPAPASSPHDPVRAPNPAKGPRVPPGVVAAVLAVLAVVGAGAWFVTGGGRDRPLGPQLTFALPYAAPSGAFRTMLPCQAQTQQQQVTIGPNLTTTVGFGACIGEDPIVMVGDAGIPAGTPGFDPDTALRGAADGAAVSSGGVVAEYQETSHDGLRAADLRISRDGATVRMRVVLGGTAFGNTRIVVAMVASEDGDPKGDFDRLVESLSVTP